MDENFIINPSPKYYKFITSEVKGTILYSATRTFKKSDFALYKGVIISDDLAVRLEANLPKTIPYISEVDAELTKEETNFIGRFNGVN